MHEEHADLLRAVDPVALGSRVRAARVSRGLTQTELGGDGVSTGYVSRIESGARRPTLTVLDTLATRLDTTLDHLLRGVSGTECDEIRLALDYAELALENGEAADAEDQARKATTRAEAAGQPRGVQRGQMLLARALEARGRLDEAIDVLEALTASSTGVDLVAAGIALSRCYREVGDLTLAIEVGERIEDVATQAGLDGTDDAVRLTMTVAAAYTERGDLHQAARRCRRTVAKAEALDSPAARSAAYWNASIVQAKLGDTCTAAQLAGRALALLREGDDERNIARLRAQTTRLLLRTDRPDIDEVVAQAERAEEDLAATSAGAIDLTMNRLTLAEAHLAAGRPDQAAGIAADALDACPPEARLTRAEGMVVLGRAHAATGDDSAALVAYHSAVELLEHAGADRAAAQLWFDLGDLLDAIDDQPSARLAYRQAATAAGLVHRRAHAPSTQRQQQ